VQMVTETIHPPEELSRGRQPKTKKKSVYMAAMLSIGRGGNATKGKTHLKCGEEHDVEPRCRCYNTDLQATSMMIVALPRRKWF
jgi:hypothetical protein